MTSEVLARHRGLTWDHPRGRVALERSARGWRSSGAPVIAWDVHPLEGFESSPIAELAERYDVIVLDHPHLGDAIESGRFRPLGELFDEAFLAGLAEASVGPSIASYRLEGNDWALPLDAATQVSARLANRVPTNPESWAEVAALAETEPVALSLAGPHAFLSFSSVCVALGVEPSVDAGGPFIDADTGARAIELLAAIARSVPSGTAALNPIGLLERMRTERDIAYIPLVYGYVNYARGDRATAITFGDAPVAVPGGRRGSTIGGTGLAFTNRSEPSRELIDYARWLLSPAAQREFIPSNDGQPSARVAWLDDRVNDEAGDFYRSTIRTIDESWVRPRVAGFTPFQSAASAILRDAIAGTTPSDRAISTINASFERLALAEEEAAS